MKELKPFLTPRLNAVPPRAGDLQQLCDLHRDPEVMKYLGGVRSKEETECWLRVNIDHWNAHGFGVWMFWNRGDSRFAGRGGLRHAQLDNRDEIEVAYALVRQYWGMGLATEIAKASVAVGFEELQRETLIVLVDSSNIASRKVAEKLGFHLERITLWKSLPTLLYRLNYSQWSGDSVPQSTVEGDG